MILLHPLQNRAFQFSLALMAKLKGKKMMDRAATEELGRRFLVTDIYLEEVLAALEQAGFLTLQKKGARWTGCLLSGKGNEFPLPQMPMGAIEREYLQYILRLPEAELFLDQKTRDELMGESPVWLTEIQRLCPKGNRSRVPEPMDVRVILKAIRSQRMISYRYRTRDSIEYKEAQSIPWKLEYSAYDHRWWVILYDERTNRTIKSVLANLKDITLGKKHDVTQEQILIAMEQLRMPEPVVLRVKNVRRALERCFLQFETQEFQETRCIGDDLYQLSFTYYRFDQEEILRKLMQLGPAVTLVSPQPLKEDLRGLLQQALKLTKEERSYEEVIR